MSYCKALQKDAFVLRKSDVADAGPIVRVVREV